MVAYRPLKLTVCMPEPNGGIRKANKRFLPRSKRKSFRLLLMHICFRAESKTRWNKKKKRVKQEKE